MGVDEDALRRFLGVTGGVFEEDGGVAKEFSPAVGEDAGTSDGMESGDADIPKST